MVRAAGFKVFRGSYYGMFERCCCPPPQCFIILLNPVPLWLQFYKAPEGGAACLAAAFVVFWEFSGGGGDF